MSIFSRRTADNGPPPRHRCSAWSGDQLLHLLDNSLAHLAMTTSLLLDRELPRGRTIHHLQVMQMHVQLLALLAQAWVTLDQDGPWKLPPPEGCDLAETLVYALHAYDRERMGIKAHASPSLPRIPGDRRDWQYVLRAMVHTAVMQRQRSELEVVTNRTSNTVTIKFRRHGEEQGGLSDNALQLLVAACRSIIEGYGGKLTVRDTRRQGWRAVAEMPFAAMIETS